MTAALDAGPGILTAGLGVALLVSGRRDGSRALLGLAMLATGGLATGIPAVEVVSTCVAIAAFTLAFLCYPSSRGRLAPGRDEVLAAAGGAGVLGTAAATALPPALSEVVVFAVALPAVGLVLLRHRGRDDLTAGERTRIRVLFAVLAGAAATTAVLLVVTAVRWIVGGSGPAFAGLLWFSRLVPIGVAVVVLTTGGAGRLYGVRRRLGAVLVVALVAALAGGLIVVLHTVTDRLAGNGHLPPATAAPAAALPAALLLNSIRVRVERWVDRLLYGRRPTPYSVLADIGSASHTSLMNVPDLARVAEAVGRGLGARVCRLTVHRPGLADRTYAWSGGGTGEGVALLTLPVVRGAEQLGTITVDRATAAGPDVHRHRLVEDVAGSLGAVLEAHRLGVELERQLRAARAHAADIAGSRRRLVAEMDAERRRIERDLHDGAQHHLVSLRLSLGLVEHRLTAGRTEDVLASLDRVAGQIDAAERIMARTAAGVTSPVLVQRGLVAALESELGGGRPAVRIDVSGMDAGRRFPADLESAVWFCCLEAVNNARKYAPGARIRLSLRPGAERLDFGVHDDGPGWDMTAGAGGPGRGLRNVTARVAAAGGLVSVRSEPGAGTRVDGWVPLPASPSSAEALVTGVREAVQDAVTRYGEGPLAERVRRAGAALDTGSAATRRDRIRAAAAALRELDALLRSDPPPAGAAHLRHRLDRIRSGTPEWAETEALDVLRSGRCDLGPHDVESAARLLGETAPDARSRLGLEPSVDESLVVTAAEQALGVWRRRASHPGSGHAVRLVAAAVVRSCEHLLHGR